MIFVFESRGRSGLAAFFGAKKGIAATQPAMDCMTIPNEGFEGGFIFIRFAGSPKAQERTEGENVGAKSTQWSDEDQWTMWLGQIAIDLGFGGNSWPSWHPCPSNDNELQELTCFQADELIPKAKLVPKPGRDLLPNARNGSIAGHAVRLGLEFQMVWGTCP